MKDNLLIVFGFFIIMFTMVSGAYVATKWIIHDVVIHSVKRECLIGNTVQKQSNETNCQETKKEKIK